MMTEPTEMTTSATRGASTPGLTAGRLTHLQRLEAEAIHIMREAVAESERPAMLYSVGKDSSVMLHLAMKAFYPSKPPFPLVHVDTTWKFSAMYEFRDRTAGRARPRADRAPEPRVRRAGHQPVRPRLGAAHRHVEDRGSQAGDRHATSSTSASAAPGATRRSRGPRSGCSRCVPRSTSGTRSASGPSSGRSTTPAAAPVRRSACFPISNWTELDVWQYIHLEQIPIVPLYFSAPRPVVDRDGVLIMVDDDRMPLDDGRGADDQERAVPDPRLLPAVGCDRERRRHAHRIIQEMLLATTSERQGRIIDLDGAASMEKKKQEGYF